jgi:hypothetical protein
MEAFLIGMIVGTLIGVCCGVELFQRRKKARED